MHSLSNRCSSKDLAEETVFASTNHPVGDGKFEEKHSNEHKVALNLIKHINVVFIQASAVYLIEKVHQDKSIEQNCVKFQPISSFMIHWIS